MMNKQGIHFHEFLKLKWVITQWQKFKNKPFPFKYIGPFKDRIFDVFFIKIFVIVIFRM